MKRFLSITETVAAVILMLIALLTAGNVLLRNVFGLSVPDWYDLSRLLLGIAMFWGISIATYRAGHICVDALWEMATPSYRRYIDLSACLITLAFLVPLAWMVWVKVSTTGTQVTSDLRLSFTWFYAVAAIGAVVAVILAGLRTYEVVRGHDLDGKLPGSGNGS